MIVSGHPQLSPMLYRQFAARRSSWVDSIALRENLRDNGDAGNIGAWIFANPWGSTAWRADLASHSMTEYSQVNGAPLINFSPIGNQMPPLATNIPDTTAMRFLGEWAATYRTLVQVEGFPIVPEPVSIAGRGPLARADMARLSGRMLMVPNGWTGKAQMFSVTGRAYNLPSVGRGQYAIPQNAPVGLYIFRIGDQTFRASVLR